MTACGPGRMHDPRAPLLYAAAPSWLARYKLQRLAVQPQACMALLAETPWRYRPVPDPDNADGCGLRDAIQVQRTSLEIGRAFTLSCPAAASTALWERHGVQPQALRYFGMPVRRMEHFGTYACRNVAAAAWDGEASTPQPTPWISLPLCCRTAAGSGFLATGTAATTARRFCMRFIAAPVDFSKVFSGQTTTKLTTITSTSTKAHSGYAAEARLRRLSMQFTGEAP